MRKGTLKKALALALTGAVLVGAFAGCGAKKDSGDKKETKKIVIGASPSPHADILKVAKKELKKEGYELEIKEYSDYVQPNTALESGDLDANYFQHKPYSYGFIEISPCINEFPSSVIFFSTILPRLNNCVVFKTEDLLSYPFFVARTGSVRYPSDPVCSI